MEKGGGTLTKHGGGRMRFEVSVGIVMEKLSKKPPHPFSIPLRLLWSCCRFFVFYHKEKDV